MLGLRRGTVLLLPHDPKWLEVAATLRSRISETTGLPVERVQHVGSTAVPGVPAKPILDFDLGLVDGEEVERIADVLVAGEGFLDRGHKSDAIGHLLVLESDDDVRTAHVHIVRHGSAAWRHDLSFREALLRDPSLRERYGKLKSDLAERFPGDRASYRHSKNAFFDALQGERTPDPASSSTLREYGGSASSSSRPLKGDSPSRDART